jgi:hypothetical protein
MCQLAVVCSTGCAYMIRRVVCRERENLLLFIPGFVVVLIYVNCEVDIGHT